MSNLKQNTIEEFQKIISEEYGRDLSLAEATEIANGITLWFDTLGKIYHPMQIEKAEIAALKNKLPEADREALSEPTDGLRVNT